MAKRISINRKDYNSGIERGDNATIVDEVESIESAMREAVFHVDSDFLEQRQAWMAASHDDDDGDDGGGGHDRDGDAALELEYPDTSAQANLEESRIEVTEADDAGDRLLDELIRANRANEAMVLRHLRQQLLLQRQQQQQQLQESLGLGFDALAPPIDPLLSDELPMFADLFTDGTTAVVACITDSNRLIVSNTGDSRALLISTTINGRYARATPLTSDHKPTDLAEQYELLLLVDSATDG